jgi:hypothetical protein
MPERLNARPSLQPVPLFDMDGALSREYLLHRGHCCGSGCRNCPYGDGETERQREREPGRDGAEEQ